jgi:hypothetical protein
MGFHPVNLAIRFILELAALVAMGVWGWLQVDGVLRFVVALAVPIAAAALWGVFAVPGDRSRSVRHRSLCQGHYGCCSKSPSLHSQSGRFFKCDCRCGASYWP